MHFLWFQFCQHITFPDDEKKPVTDPTANSWLDLTKLWILGDKYQVRCSFHLWSNRHMKPFIDDKQMAAFQNNIMHCLFAKLRASLNGNIPDITPDVFEYLYANTLPSACLREVLVAISVRNMCIGHFTEHRAEFPREFLEDFALNQMRVICLFDPSKITEFPKTLPKRYLKEEYSNDTATGSTTAIRGQKNSKGKKDRRTPISDLFKALGDRIDSLEADTEFAFQGSP
jgi:hypothetical protein